MLGNPEPACLVIADISGYTSFLAGAELDHAQDVLADLVGTVVGALRPTFRLAKLEGDAAFGFRLAETLDGPATQDAVERCYFTFRRRLRDIGQASSCDCNSCMLVPSLDLKLVVHHGPIVRQRIAGREELVGSPVVVVHRLLKNHVIEDGGPRAYALYTEAALAAMGLDDPGAAGLVEHRESFEGVGEVGGWVRDLEAAWQEEMERARIVVEARDSGRTYETAFAAPAAVVWEFVTSPRLRPMWQHGVVGVDERQATTGRRGVGTVNHCIHGADAVIEQVLDWRPYEYVTYRSQLPAPGVPPLLSTYLFEEDGAGNTRLQLRFGRPKAAKDRAILEAMLPDLDVMMADGIEGLHVAIGEAVAERTAVARTEPPEPALAVSAGRNISQPVGRTV
jgi:uncharacterized protein YndB with AHSA1/START domain